MKNSILILAIVVASVGFRAHGEAKIDFAKQIQPLFEQSCIKCHGPEKHKGDLRLDSKEAALKGGKDAVAIVPGDAAKSDLYRRITLPAGHDDIMPSKGDLLTKAQSDLIRDWINQGAVWPEGAVAKATPEKAAETVVKIVDIKPTAAEIKAIAKLEALGIAIRPVAMNLNWHEANFRSQAGSNSVDAAVAQLKDVLSLVDLNLAGAKFSDDSLVTLKGLTNLTHLHLEHTQVKDAALANLKDLANLRYLNLFDTAITDAGLEHLKGLTNLKNLHLWQTKVTDAGVTNLQIALPKCSIIRGWEITPAAKKEEKKADKEPAKK
jgi:mono/diheme cytochrome c family protein